MEDAAGVGVLRQPHPGEDALALGRPDHDPDWVPRRGA